MPVVNYPNPQKKLYKSSTVEEAADHPTNGAVVLRGSTFSGEFSYPQRNDPDWFPRHHRHRMFVRVKSHAWTGGGYSSGPSIVPVK